MPINKVIIDLNAIKHNFEVLKRLAGAGTQIIAVVKSDAYGHGMIPVYKALESAGAADFGVFELNEAIALRKGGCSKPILIMMGVLPEEAPAVVDHALIPALFRLEAAQALSEAAVAGGTTVAVHVKVDTGMCRLGVPWSEAGAFARALLPLSGLRVEGLFSHFAVADEPGHPFTEEQLKRFRSALEAFLAAGVSPPRIHMANSAGLLTGKGLEFGVARPGISLYGSPPAPGWPQDLGLKQAMTFKSRVVHIKRVPPNTPVSYGCTYKTPAAAVIATIPVGYDDGYSRKLSNRGQVLVRGRKAPVVGRVCMNLTMLDVSAVEGVSVGDEVVLLGRQGNEVITADELAGGMDTISYEVYCAIGKSNPRTYLS